MSNSNFFVGLFRQNRKANHSLERTDIHVCQMQFPWPIFLVSSLEEAERIDLNNSNSSSSNMNERNEEGKMILHVNCVKTIICKSARAGKHSRVSLEVT